jgi:hypothetical protein
VLARDGVERTIPSYQAIDFLRRAEEQEGAPEDAVEGIRARILDEGAPLATVSRQFRDSVFPIDAAKRRELDAAGLRNVAKRLRELLAETRAVPRKLAGEVAVEVDRLLEALAAKNSEEAA